MLFGDNLVDFAEFSTKSEEDRDKMFEQLKADLGINSSSSLTLCTDHGKLRFIKVRKKMLKGNQKLV